MTISQITLLLVLLGIISVLVDQARQAIRRHYDVSEILKDGISDEAPTDEA